MMKPNPQLCPSGLSSYIHEVLFLFLILLLSDKANSATLHSVSQAQLLMIHKGCNEAQGSVPTDDDGRRPMTMAEGCVE